MKYKVKGTLKPKYKSTLKSEIQLNEKHSTLMLHLEYNRTSFRSTKVKFLKPINMESNFKGLDVNISKMKMVHNFDE
jgi:hypothetical protein